MKNTAFYRAALAATSVLAFLSPTLPARAIVEDAADLAFQPPQPVVMNFAFYPVGGGSGTVGCSSYVDENGAPGKAGDYFVKDIILPTGISYHIMKSGSFSLVLQTKKRREDLYMLNDKNEFSEILCTPKGCVTIKHPSRPIASVAETVNDVVNECEASLQHYTPPVPLARQVVNAGPGLAP